MHSAASFGNNEQTGLMITSFWNIIIQSYSSLSMPFLPYFVYWCQISTCNPKPTHRSLRNTHALFMEKCQPPVRGQQQ